MLGNFPDVLDLLVGVGVYVAVEEGEKYVEIEEVIDIVKGSIGLFCLKGCSRDDR